MYYINFSKTGGPEVLNYEKLSISEPKENEVLIKHSAIGLNFIDTYHRSGLYPVPLPSSIGLEGAGIIEKVGPSVKNFKEGDKVAYETAKSAVIGLTRSFAREFGKYNIRCNSVTPGSIATERQIKHWLTPKYKKFILDKQCLKRQLKPDDVASLVVHLSSDVSSGCTKQNFIIDAGIT